ncbi:O-antigen ligase family protein [Streptomyces camelliae]|uniref:O-antigen ligase family protein n=1 Tax=Streptomyces camelliae TaxID=3004093 RepID=A0ABY7P5B4_9ACTN|nr:O-antigen ligase family protein [Streptomyces sp. HUAS 2-6]WBO64902.1 O-antigen ligase family protein [Streptomyces sp. HUAS 2-6]
MAARLATAALWVIGLSPAFFATVVWDRASSPPGGAVDWGATTAEVTPTDWRLHAGELYALATITLLVAVLVFSLAAPPPAARHRGVSLVVAVIAMYCGPVLSGLFGAHGGAGDWRLWLAPLAVAALYAAPPVELGELLPRLRAVLRVYTWGSLGALVIMPDWALSTSYIVNLRLPVMGSSRLLGLTNHPILLGVLAAATLVVELAPLHRRRLWLLHSAAAAVVLLLAQSRTAWMATLVALLFLYRRGVARRMHPLLVRGLALAFVACSLPLVLALTGQIGRLASDGELTSVHGRTEVWEMAMLAFHSDPLWGYGPTLFSDRFSPVRGLYEHAHSQLYQTLGTSGLIGMLGLLAFAAVLLLAASRTARVSAGLSPSLVAITTVTCLTEAPLRGVGFSPYLVLVVLDITILLAAVRGSGAEPEPEPAGLYTLPHPAPHARYPCGVRKRLEAVGSAAATHTGSGR